MQQYNTNSLTPTKILHLQHTLGNQAVVRLLAPNSAIAPGNTIQRTVTQILPGEDGKVGKLLKEETKLPAKIGDVPLLEEEETPLVVDKEETAKAEETEEETLEEETKKQPIATQVVLGNDGPFGYNKD